MADDPVRRKFIAALDALVADVKADRSVLAALLCGSLSHDTVWAKSDIDLVLVTIDDRKVEHSDLSLFADGVNVHAILIPRSEFRRMVEGSVRNSFAHSFLTKGRLLYTHDPTIEALCATLTDIGQRDRQVQLLRAASHALPAIDGSCVYSSRPLARNECMNELVTEPSTVSRNRVRGISSACTFTPSA